MAPWNAMEFSTGNQLPNINNTPALIHIHGIDPPIFPFNLHYNCMISTYIHGIFHFSPISIHINPSLVKGSLGGETSVLRTFRMSGKELVKERVSKEKELVRERVSQRKS